MTSECQIAKSSGAEYQLKNKALYFEVDNLQTKLKASHANFEQQIKGLENELATQTQLADNYRQLTTNSEQHVQHIQRKSPPGMANASKRK